MSNQRRFFPQTRGAQIMLGVIAVYVAFIYWLALRRFGACLSQSGDTTVFECALYNTLKGNLFWNFASGASYFEAHPEPLLFLYLPLYAIHPSPQLLIFLQTLCLAVSAVPVFLLGRRLLKSDAGAVCAATAFLFFPSLAALGVGQVHTVVFALPFLMFAFYFFHEERFWPFVVLIALTSLGKESFPMTAAMFAPYAFFKKRHWRWIVVSLVIPVSLLLFDLDVVRPHFAEGHTYAALQYFPGMGDSLGAFAKTVITRPDMVAERMLNMRNGVYLALLLCGVGYFLPFLSLAVIFTIPELSLNLLSSYDGMKVIAYLYNCEAGAFLVVASLFGIASLDRRLQKSLGAGRYGVVLAAAMLVLCVSNWWQWLIMQEYQYDAFHDTRERAFQVVPPDDSLVAGPGQVLAHLAHRKFLADQKMVTLFPDQKYDYNWVFFDMNYQRPILGEYVPRELIMGYATNGNYQLVFAENNIYVLRRKEPFPTSQLTPIRYTSDEPLLKRMMEEQQQPQRQ